MILIIAGYEEVQKSGSATRPSGPRCPGLARALFGRPQVAERSRAESTGTFIWTWAAAAADGGREKPGLCRGKFKAWIIKLESQGQGEAHADIKAKEKKRLSGVEVEPTPESPFSCPHAASL